jgi:hypothetical protein
VWGWFWALHARRSSGFAPNPISYADIAAWAALMGARPSPWEVWLITRLDDAFLSRKPPDPEKTEAPAGDGPQAVHALFATMTGRQPRKGGVGDIRVDGAGDRKSADRPAPGR